MTYLEKAKIDNPDMTYDIILNESCPYDFGYEDNIKICPENGNCIKCWARDYGTTGKEKD